MKTEREIALEKQLERLKKEVTNLQGALVDRNRQLDAMHWAWCSGGCKTGMHRWTPVELTEDLVATAEMGVRRMRAWFTNAEFKLRWQKMSPIEREEWMEEQKAILRQKGYQL